MADPRFFTNRGPIPLGKLADICGAALPDGADPARLVRDVAPLDSAGPDELSFLDNTRYLDAFRATRAGFCVAAPKFARQAPAGTVVLACDKPYRSYALAAQAFYPPRALRPGVHPRAVIDAGAKLGPDCEIGPGVVIEAGAEIGARCRIGANAVIEANVVVGDDCLIGAQVSLSHCRIGSRVTLYPGARVGQDGFGFAPDLTGHVKVPQLGRVLIGDDCEIGANSTIDRGAGPDTIVGSGTWIDNLVQIGHNVQIGRGSIIIAQVGIAGSARLGDFVAMGGQAAVAGHLTIGTGAQIAAQAGVIADVAPGQRVGGSPALPIREFFRHVGILRRLAKQRGTGE
jgi:UDP-3-O-[3-hydroxymyristoyl] glucosamine N-acyltransferase